MIKSDTSKVHKKTERNESTQYTNDCCVEASTLEPSMYSVEFSTPLQLEELLVKERLALVMREIFKLKPKDQLLFFGAIKGIPTPEMARHMGMDPTYARRRYAKACEMIKKKVKKYLEE
jgi:hypothetical protein